MEMASARGRHYLPFGGMRSPFILEVMGPVQESLRKGVSWQNVGKVNWGAEGCRVRGCGSACQFHYLVTRVTLERFCNLHVMPC